MRSRGGPTAFQVVVVEDHAELRDALAEALAYAGMDVRAHGSAAAALDAIEARVPDVVLTDLSLGGAYSGVSIARALRGAARTADLTIVLMTGTGGPRFEDERLFDAVLFKPIEVTKLADTLRTFAAARARTK